MSKARFFGTDADRIFLGTSRRPSYKVYLWNPNRTTISEVVLGIAKSPRYDITNFVVSCEVAENITFEDQDNQISTNAGMVVKYLPDQQPIPITERTMIDGAPIQILQGDEALAEHDYVPIFTGVIRGNPTMVEKSRGEQIPQQMTITCVGRAENFLNRVVTARAYPKDEDVGRSAVETAIEWMDLDRREIKIGHQDYAIGHTHSQLVDVEVLKGIWQILFTVGKKPKFDADGFLTAADTDLEREPIRTYPSEMTIEVRRTQRQGAVYNSVRLLGLANIMTQVVEREKRLAHGDITSGWFETVVRQEVWFSETPGKQSGGRRAQNTRAEKEFGVFGAVGGSFRWTPYLEEDGFTVFGGEIKFNTGYAPWVYTALVVTYLVIKLLMALLLGQNNSTLAAAAEVIATIVLVGLLVAMQNMGRVAFEIFGQPFQNVFQQLAATAALDGILTKDIKEREIRNDWIYDINVLEARAKELLRRELAKGWTYTLRILEDPIVDVDDIIRVDGRDYYVTSIRRILTRSRPQTEMIVTAWRLS
jgi:hypothetical protein